MALPAGALSATLTAGGSIDVAGGAASVVSLTLRPERRLVWAADGTSVEAWRTVPVVGTAGASVSLPVLADQPGVLTSLTVDGAPVMGEIRSWTLIAEWTVQSADGRREHHRRRLAAPAAGATVDLDLLPEAGVTTPGTVTHSQDIYIGADAVPQVAEDAATASAAALAAGLSASAAAGSAQSADGDAQTAAQAALDAQTAQGLAEDARDAALSAKSGAEDARDLAVAAQQATEAVGLTIGTVTTGAPGTSASAAITGAAPDLVLNLTIPQGAKGDTGATPNLTVGTVTKVAAGGTPTLSITGTTPNLILNAGLVTGDTGSPSAYELRGTGMPEGVVTANPGTYYTDTAGTNGAWRWLKTSGTGNTGWTVVVGDTGWRKIGNAGLSSGYVAVSRVNNTVSLSLKGGTWDAFTLTAAINPATSLRVIPTSGMPTGFRSFASIIGQVTIDGRTIVGGLYLSSIADSYYLDIRAFAPPAPAIPADPTILRASALTYLTLDPWPTTLPGTPV